MPAFAVLSVAVVFIFVCVAWLLYRNILNEQKIKELEKRLDNQTQQREGLEEQVEEMNGRLIKVEDWSAENPTLLLARADTWIEDIRCGSSRVDLQEQVLPVLRRVCESTDTSYWLVQVGRKLKKAKRLVNARNGQGKDNILSQIDDMTDRFGIDLDKV